MILAANTSSTMRVAVYTPHRKLAGHLHRVVARAGGGDDRVPNARASTLSIAVFLPAFQSAAVRPTFGSVISGVSSLARVAWGRTVERSRTIFALRFVPAFSRIRRDIRPGLLNFCRAFKAAGKPSFLRALVKLRQKSTSSIFETFSLSPVLSPVPVLHESNKHQKDGRDHGKSTRKYG